MNSNNVLLQQDGAPSHTAKHHQLPAERKVTFIQAAMWPVDSPDLNLVDYAVYEVLQQRVYCIDCLKLEQLKQAIVGEWCALSEKFTDRTINDGDDV